MGASVKMTRRLFVLLMSSFLSLYTPQTFGWGKRGHQIVGETSARLASLEKTGAFLRSRSYDFGYYNNVPDFIWKIPATYQLEKNEHFMDLEIFHRAFRTQPEVTSPFSLSRHEFEEKFPNIPLSAGRAYWRIRELFAQLTKITEQLRALGTLSEKTKNERRSLQEKWLVVAGTLGHYVADLAQPLHVTENYDGQLTKQKGLHSFFEETCVDELYPGLLVEVMQQSETRWTRFKKENQKKSVDQLVEHLTEESFKHLDEVLKTDRRVGRTSVAKSAKAHKKIILDRLVAGSLTLAEIYRRQLGWEFDGDRFYYFGSNPPHIPPNSPPSNPKNSASKQ